MPMIKIIPPPGIMGVFRILKKIILNSNEHFGEEIICFSCLQTGRKAVSSLFFPECSDYCYML